MCVRACLYLWMGVCLCVYAVCVCVIVCSVCERECVCERVWLRSRSPHPVHWSAHVLRHGNGAQQLLAPERSPGLLFKEHFAARSILEKINLFVDKIRHSDCSLDHLFPPRAGRQNIPPLALSYTTTLGYQGTRPSRGACFSTALYYFSTSCVLRL